MNDRQTRQRVWRTFLVDLSRSVHRAEIYKDATARAQSVSLIQGVVSAGALKYDRIAVVLIGNAIGRAAHGLAAVSHADPRLHLAQGINHFDQVLQSIIIDCYNNTISLSDSRLSNLVASSSNLMQTLVRMSTLWSAISHSSELQGGDSIDTIVDDVINTLIH